jgi:hypothetical protein
MTRDVILGTAIGLAIAMMITAVILIARPVHSQPPVVLPSIFTPAPIPAPHCTAATLTPAPLQGHPGCAESAP